MEKDRRPRYEPNSLEELQARENKEIYAVFKEEKWDVYFKKLSGFDRTVTGAGAPILLHSNLRKLGLYRLS